MYLAALFNIRFIKVGNTREGLPIGWKSSAYKRLSGCLLSLDNLKEFFDFERPTECSLSIGDIYRSPLRRYSTDAIPSFSDYRIPARRFLFKKEL